MLDLYTFLDPRVKTLVHLRPEEKTIIQDISLDEMVKVSNKSLLTAEPDSLEVVHVSQATQFQQTGFGSNLSP